MPFHIFGTRRKTTKDNAMESTGQQDTSSHEHKLPITQKPPTFNAVMSTTTRVLTRGSCPEQGSSPGVWRYNNNTMLSSMPQSKPQPPKAFQLPKSTQYLYISQN